MSFKDAFVKGINYISNDISKAGEFIGLNDANRKFNSAEAQKERDWQTEMSNTAHQREVADLQEAGLNPVLSATGGVGATSSSGALAHGVSSSGNGLGQLASIMNSASSVARVMNNDKSKSNNMDSDDLVSFISKVSRFS